MMYKNISVLLALVPLTLAATFHQCIAFEKSLNGKPTGLNVTTSRELSLLLYHMNDIKNTNIPFALDQQLLTEEPEGFKVCTQKVHAVGGCENIGEFVIKFKDERVKDNIINKVSYPGESTYLEVKDYGLACVMAYEEGIPSIDDIKVQEIHSYGKLGLFKYGALETTLVACLIIFIAGLYLFFNFFKKLDIKKLDTLDVSHKFLALLVIISFTFYSGEFFSLSLYNSDHLGDAFTSLWNTFNNGIYRILFFNLLYHFSLNRAAIGALYGDYSKLYSACLIIYAVNSISEFAAILLNPNSGGQLAILGGISILSAFAWIPVYYVLYKNSKKTIEDIMDVIYWRSYSISRKTFLFCPIVLKAVSFFALFTISMNSTYKALGGRRNVSQRELTLIFLNVFNSIAQPGIIALFLHVDILAIPMIVVSQIYVWRPRVVPKLVNDDVENFEIEDEEVTKKRSD